jgi:hypothetical protein
VTSLLDVFVTVKPDVDKFGPEVKKKLKAIDTKKEGSQVAGRFGVGFNGAFGGIVKHSAGLFVGAFAAIKGVEFLGGFINDARESAKVGRISAAVIKSTGGVAHITAAQIGDLATAISNKTGADDEAIQSGENLLATFTNVRNETGKGNDIFNRATQAAVDMAAAMNNGVVDAGGLKTANIQLGKALNDPIKGITALGKAGVSFTAEQKKQIKSYVASGDTLKAQKIILAEVGKEFGGAAAAAADPLTRLSTIGGNLAEKVGGFLLPSVDKFATFIGDTAIPKISAFSDVFAAKVTPKLQEFGGFIQTEVLPRLLDFGGFLKDEVLPRVLEFGDFLVGKAIPAVAKFATNLATTLAPIVQTVFGFFKTEVIPRLKDFAEFLGDKVLPKIGELATSLSKNKDFLVPFVATLATGVLVFQAVGLAIKAWAAVQAVLNVVLAANPIGLVIIGIAALVGGIIYAYKNSEKFREILQGAFHGIQEAAQTFAPLVKAAIDIVIGVFKLWWNYFAKPILAAFWGALKFAWEKAQDFGKIVGAAFNAIKEPARVAIKFVVDHFLGFVQAVLDGAATAFGWVPELGPKLKAAAKHFGEFRDNVNKKLDGINDEPVDIKVGLAYTAALGQKTKQMTFADGGGVFGGTRGKDSVPALLMPDEHVWATREVAAAGGHVAMKRMRQAALAGELNGYRDGGVVVNPKIPSKRQVQMLANAASGDVTHTGDVMAKTIGKKLAAQAMGPGGPPGARRSFRGVTLNTRTIGMLLNAERLLGRVFHITQGSYSTRVAASGSTHAGGGAMDTNGPGGWNAAVSALRKVGFAAWHRTPAMGPWGHHIHSIALGDSSASPAAKAQMASFRRGGDGLGHGMAMGGAVTKKMARDMGMQIFDGGGRWKSGTLAANTSGKTETVIPGGDTMTVRLSDEDRRLLREAGARPINLDGRRVDEALSRTAMGRGY